MTSPFGGQQLVQNPFTGQWEYSNPFGGGPTDQGGYTFTPNPNPLTKYDQSGTISFMGIQIGSRDTNGADHILPSTILDLMFGGGGGGSTWRSGEREQNQQQLDYTQRHYENQDAQDALKNELQALNDQYTLAINAGNLALARQIEQRMAANAAQTAALTQQQQALDAALGQAQVGANVYGTQTQGRSSLASTMAQLTKDAADAAANPFNPLGYLDLNAAAGGATPFSNATPAQNTTYTNAMAQAYQSKYGTMSDMLNRAMEQTYQTPANITTALEGTKPWYEGMPNWAGSSQGQKALYRGLTPEQQRFIANATPEQLRYIGG